MPAFDRDGLSFHYLDRGEGVAFVFQHGLGGDVAQPFGLYTPPSGVRLLGFDARAHGETRPLGDVKKVAIAATADDLVALLDHLGIGRAVVGGLSMGAAVALNVALRYPDRVLGLVLALPSSIDRPLPGHARVFPHIAQHVLKYGAAEGLERFRRTLEFQAVQAGSAAAARSLERQFTEPRAEECVARLERIPHDAPCHDRDELSAINAPALVLGRRHDPLHPWDVAEALAQLLPRASLKELTPESESLERYASDIQAGVDDYFRRHFLR